MKVAVILAVLVALVACNELSARIEVSHHNYVPGQELLVNWELVNTAVKPLRLLTWGTPIESEWNSYMFHIVNIESGVSAAYQGRVFKRASPQIENYSTLSQNVAVSGALDLAQGYHFYEAGRYEITMHFVAKPLVGEPFVVQSNTVEIHVARPDAQPEARQEISAPGSRAVTFNGCTSTEQSTVNNAISLAVSGSANVETYLAQSGNPPKCTTVFTKWFGTYDSTNWNQIETDFQKINNLLASNNFGIDCTCNQPGTYAYVYPNDKTHTIYLCPVFWTSKTTGYNTQPGTLTHESSHFTDVAGTDDIQYGVAGCLDLAKTNPSRAVKNADSHEYLQEDNPSTSGTSC